MACNKIQINIFCGHYLILVVDVRFPRRQEISQSLGVAFANEVGDGAVGDGAHHLALLALLKEVVPLLQGGGQPLFCPHR